MSAKSLHSCPILCNPKDYNLPGFPVHEILQAKCWSALPCPPPGNLPDQEWNLHLLCLVVPACGFFTTSSTWKAHHK